MAATSITFQIDADKLLYCTDAYLAQLWHIGQANPAPFGDAQACDFAEQVGREIVRRWLAIVLEVCISHLPRGCR